MELVLVRTEAEAGDLEFEVTLVYSKCLTLRPSQGKEDVFTLQKQDQELPRARCAQLATTEH